MDLSKNRYRKFLVDEVISCSKTSVADAFQEVTEFSKTQRFEDSYKKWVFLNKKNERKAPRPRSIGEIIHGIGN